MNYSLNERAAQIVEERLLPDLDALGVSVYTLPCGATVLDMGIEAKGGFLAAKYFSEAAMGGLGELTYRTMQVGDHLLPVAAVHVDRPVVAELGAHDAFLYVQWHGVNYSVGGPIRAVHGTDFYVQSLPYRDSGASRVVATIQTDQFPDNELLLAIAEKAAVDPASIYLMAARTGTLTGAAQVCARNVEQSLPSLLDHGFPVETIVQACGYAPIPSVVDDEMLAYGRVNDGLIYGQETNLYVDCEDAEIERLVDVLPFSKNKDVYGTPFEILFAQCGHLWRNVPREWDAPCKVNFFNLRTGHSFEIGALHCGVLERAFLGTQSAEEGQSKKKGVCGSSGKGGASRTEVI